MAFRMTGRALGALVKERNDVQPALRKVWKAHEHTDGLVRRLQRTYVPVPAELTALQN